MENRPSTLGELEASDWRPRSVREEIRHNLVEAIRSGSTVLERWPGIHGYEKTVLPQIENAILSRHDFILLGLRGQAKTRILRMMTGFLDPYLPALDGCDLNDDPFAPLSKKGRELVRDQGREAPLRCYEVVTERGKTAAGDLKEA